ncbi:isocitrate lyase/phosphoenolpyruvate mutase family protein [Microbulbifer sp. OS29]|uniref:Isocitrate lyase/phosphoenolpyruvate mutase family protein n=1 Tax=Microbulbifer okhotskensis TaxID=2926617 RepID=A0A9X2ERE3_9GAMM|nr:isocitrate lyase/phosphoenolpyruvate mutase family protein [Microbulbifer okhotskensis]MCO1334158.1 isocitrate lyase/phosphoenolpyruvate mutase family protein [Microbulbifer okhotskensis]
MNNSPFNTFTQLHQAAAPLVLPNAWDAASALLCQNTGALAVGTSSAAVAWSLGYADGGALPVEEHLHAIARIARVTSLPLTVDIEDGYSQNPEEIAELACKMVKLGVVGINIEEGRGIPEPLSEKIHAIRKALNGRPLFINARTDVYLNALASGDKAINMCIERLELYKSAGADSGFVPGLAAVEEARSLAAGINLPLNIMLLPGMAPVSEFFAAGIKRFSTGPALFQSVYGHLNESLKQLTPVKSNTDLFSKALDYSTLNSAFIKEAYREAI